MTAGIPSTHPYRPGEFASGWAVVAVVMGYVLLLYQLPLVPLLAVTFVPQAMSHCTHERCACVPGRPCSHHRTHGHAASSPHGAGASWQTCGPPAAPSFVILTLDKALFPAVGNGPRSDRAPEPRPRAVRWRPARLVTGIFHPPRSGPEQIVGTGT